MKATCQYSIDLPKSIEIEPTQSCNLKCQMCHVSYMPNENIETLALEHILKLNDLRGCYVTIGSGFEPSMHKDMSKILDMLEKLECKIEFVTNATLMSDDLVQALRNSNLKLMNFSFDGINKETFEKIRRGASYEDVIENILDFRHGMASSNTLFAVNSTMMRSNMYEMHGMLEFWEKHEFDLIRFIIMVVRDMNSDLVKESLYPVRQEFYELLDDVALDILERGKNISIRNPYFVNSPLKTKYKANFDGDEIFSSQKLDRRVPLCRQLFQLGNHPGMRFPCRSPFTFARILWNGDVELCYRYKIGNLGEADFTAIWNSERAHLVRKKIMDNIHVCSTCDYYRFCLQSNKIVVDDIENYFTQELMPHIQEIDFDTGLVDKPIPGRPPRLIESVLGNNLVEYNGFYYIIPQSFGPFDLREVDLNQYPAIQIVDSLRKARKVAALSS